MLCVVRRHAWIPFLVLYFLLDFCTPVIEGAVSFDVAKCVDCAQVERLSSAPPAGVGQLLPGLVAMTPSGQALRPAPSPEPAGATTRLPLHVRSAFAASADPPDSAEDH
jgi:hypothetical protein